MRLMGLGLCCEAHGTGTICCEAHGTGTML